MNGVKAKYNKSTGISLWLLSAGLWVAGLVVERVAYSDNISCQLPGAESTYGRPGWSWLPLGHTCTWENVGGSTTVVDNPSFMTLAPPVILALWLVSIVALRSKNSTEKISENRKISEMA